MASNIINYITSKWQQVATNYKNLIIKDPDIASKMEAILRMISYFIQGQ